MIDPYKYIVFKREELDELVSVLAGVDVESIRLKFGYIALDDALVIRKRDVFAAQALYAYSHQILTAIEIAKSPKALDVEFLQELADYFAGEADVAASHGEVPTP